MALIADRSRGRSSKFAEHNALAVRCDVDIRTLRAVLAGEPLCSRARLRCANHLIQSGLGHLVAPAVEEPAPRGER
jgi:hypothetical protein